MDVAEKHQRELLDYARRVYRQTPISEATVNAYLTTPRHLFVRRYREFGIKDWRDVTDANLSEHLAALYADRPLVLSGDNDDDIASTISQPSFVLRMLDMLQLEAGQRVFELGAGSGWNAALIGRIVGPTGRVYSVEILPDVGRAAKETLSRLGFTNVEVIVGDGGEGYAAGGPYDRMTFTAGTYDLPCHFYDQIVEGGLLLVVVKTAGGGDSLFILRKVGDHFESVTSMPCGFVQMTGKYKVNSFSPIALSDLPFWDELQHREVGRRPFWWGTKDADAFAFSWQTMGVRSFLGITEPTFRSFKVPSQNGEGEQQFFGLFDETRMSLVLARNEELISYGSDEALNHLRQALHRWVDLGMPSASSFKLKAYKSDADVRRGDSQWLTKRSESQFLWALDA